MSSRAVILNRGHSYIILSLPSGNDTYNYFKGKKKEQKKERAILRFSFSSDYLSYHH